MKKSVVAVAVATMVLAGSSLAQPAGSSGGMSMPGMQKRDMDMKGMDQKKDEAGRAAAHKISGTVKEVDPIGTTVTLDHGPVKTLNWPAMSMKFKLGDKVSMDKLKKGNKVDVDVVQRGKDYVVTAVR